MTPEVDNIGIITLNPDRAEEYKERINSIMHVPGKNYRFLANAFNGKLGSTLMVATKSRLYPFWNQNKPDSDEFWNREMTAGEIGCVLSHINMWMMYAQAFRENPNYYDKSVIIFEEDFYPAESTIDWFRVDELKDYKWDILFLGRRLQKGETDTEVGLKHFVKPGFCYQAHAYILSKEGLDKLLNYYVPVLKRNLIPTDEFLPATYMDHPREDINRLFPIKRMNALATREDWFLQTDWEGTGRSRTAPNEVEL